MSEAPATDPPTSPTYLAYGDEITDLDNVSLDPSLTYSFLISPNDGARWIGLGTYQDLQGAFIRDHARRKERGENTTVFAAERAYSSSRTYIDYQGRRSTTPVNAMPYILDFRHVLANFAHQAVSGIEPKLRQIIGANSQQIHPDHPHDDASAHSYGAVMDWVRSVIGLIWTDLKGWEDLPAADITNPIFIQQRDLVHTRIGLLCIECGTGQWVRQMQMNMDTTTQRALLATGALHAMNRTATPWTAGSLIGSKPGGKTVQEAHNEWVAAFEKAIRHYDDNDLGNVPPRGENDRPIYIPAHFFPPSPVQY